MEIQIGIKKQFRYLALPIIWHILDLFLAGSISKVYRIYLEFVFYTGLSLYFIAIGSISFKSLLDEWKSGKTFWRLVLYTIIGEIIAFGIGMTISIMLPHVDAGINVYKITGWPSFIAFIITTIFLPSIAEEAFYRKGIINFNNKILLTLSSIIGIILYASGHSLKPLGLLISAIWGIPFTISYVKTKNIYISMTAHFICNLLANGATAIFIAAKMLKT